jgi:hypothetical protein
VETEEERAAENQRRLRDELATGGDRSRAATPEIDSIAELKRIISGR